MPVKRRVQIVRKIVTSPLLESLGAFLGNKNKYIEQKKKNIDNVRQIPNKTLYICILNERLSAKACNGMVKRQYNELLCSHEHYKVFYPISSTKATSRNPDSELFYN